MGLVKVRDMIIPHIGVFDFNNFGGTPFVNFAIDAAGEKVAKIIQVDKAGTINKVGFCVGASTTPQTLRVSLQPVDLTTGFPTGTLYGGSTAGTQAAPAASTYYEVTLGTGATAVAGDIIAVVIEFDSTVGNVSISFVNSNVSSSVASEFPYGSHFTAAWARVGETPVTHLGYNDASYEPTGCLPFSGVVAGAISNASTPDEVALRFKLPFTCKVRGLFLPLYLRGDLDLVLYDAASSVLGTKSFDAEFGGVNSDGLSIIKLNSAVNVTKNLVYRFALKPTSGTDIFPIRFNVLSNDILDTYGGKELYWSERTDAGAWTDVTTRRLFAGIIIEEVHDAGGGLLVHPGMQGGVRG